MLGFFCAASLSSGIGTIKKKKNVTAHFYTILDESPFHGAYF